MHHKISMTVSKTKSRHEILLCRRHNQWFQYFQLAFLEIPNVTIQFVFQNQVAYINRFHFLCICTSFTCGKICGTADSTCSKEHPKQFFKNKKCYIINLSLMGAMGFTQRKIFFQDSVWLPSLK